MRKEDFPDTATIKTRLKQFEEHFVSLFLVSFNSLPVRLRAAIVSLAVRKPEPETVDADTGKAPPGAVSLYHYFRCPPSVAAAIEARRDYVITVPETVFRDAVTARRSGVVDVDDDGGKMASKMATGNTVARDAALAAAKMAADELSRIYEYQLALLAEDAAVKMVAGHAVDCVIDYVVAGRRTVARLLDRNTIVQGKIITLLVLCVLYAITSTTCPKKTCDYIFYNIFNNNGPITIIFGTVSSKSMCHRKMVSFPTSPI